MKQVYLREFKVFKKRYQKSFWWTVLIFIVTLTACVTLSFSMAEFFIKQTENIAESIADNVTEMSGKEISELQDIQTFLLIFWNNLKVGTIIIILGSIPFYRLPTFFAVFQFIVIGMVFGGLSAMGHDTVKAFIFSFLPHAVFELTALVYCVVIGNFINKNILTKIFFRKKRDSEPFGELLKQSLRSYIFVVIPLLLIAAFIEGFITSRLSENFL